MDASNLQLFCTPAVNLFDKARIDRIHVSDSTYEFHVVADRTRPLDFEIYEVTEVVGHGVGDDSEQQFLPFYESSSRDIHDQSAYFTTRRQLRVIPPDQRRRVRSGYVGSEVFLSLVDSKQAPYSADLRQLSIRAQCTNRDLAMQMPLGLGQSDFSLNVAAPVMAVRVISGPTRPFSPIADGAIAWRAISHLSLNYLSLVGATGQQGAKALRDLLELYATTTDISARRQIEGIVSVNANRVVRRLPGRGPIAFGRGVRNQRGSGRNGVRGGQRFPARGGARSLLRALRLDQRGNGNGAPLAEPRRNQPMDAKLGNAADALTFLDAVSREPYRYDFYQTLRRLECLYADKPLWGTALRPIDEPVRFGQEPELIFSPAPLSALELGRDGAPPRLMVRLFGLLGPNGPLPLHITEYARERLRHAGDPALCRFLDLFHHRFIALFYRAWAQAQPQVNRDRPGQDRFRVYVGSFVGIAPEALRGRDSVSDLARLFHAGTLIRQVRNAEGLAQIVAEFFGVKARVEEFVSTLARVGAGDAHAAGAYRDRAGRRGRPGTPGLGSSGQVPPPSRTAHARRVPDLSSRRRFAAGRSREAASGCANWSTGCAST